MSRLDRVTGRLVIVVVFAGVAAAWLSGLWSDQIQCILLASIVAAFALWDCIAEFRS